MGGYPVCFVPCCIPSALHGARHLVLTRHLLDGWMDGCMDGWMSAPVVPVPQLVDLGSGVGPGPGPAWSLPGWQTQQGPVHMTPGLLVLPTKMLKGH